MKLTFEARWEHPSGKRDYYRINCGIWTAQIMPRSDGTYFILAGLRSGMRNKETARQPSLGSAMASAEAMIHIMHRENEQKRMEEGK